MNQSRPMNYHFQRTPFAHRRAPARPSQGSAAARNTLLLAVAATMAACQVEELQVSEQTNTYTVSREDLPINVKEGGELVAVNEVVVRSQIEGNATILSLIAEGTLVKPGDKLVEMDVSQLVEKRATQEISVEKARNSLEQARTAAEILERELLTKKNTAESQSKISAMELEKLLGAKDGRGSEGKNADMVLRLQELVAAPAEVETAPDADPKSTPPRSPSSLINQVHPQNYAGLIDKVTRLLKVEDEDGDPLQRDMGEMANKILQQADQIRLAMADLKVKEDTADYSRRLAAKQFITRNELQRDELAYQSQASKVTIAWNDLELLVNYTLERDKIELKQNLANAELEVDRVKASNDAERKNSQFDIGAKQKEYEVAAERLQNLQKQIGNSVLYSPGSGLVVYSKVSRGRGDSEPIEEGTSIRERQSIIILPDNSKLQCEIKVQEAMIDKVRVGMPAHISAEVRPNETLRGRVIYVAPVADSQSRWSGNDKKVYTTKVLLDGVNTDEALKAGMKAAATIAVDTVKGVLTVPIQAVRRDRAINYVWKKTPEGAVAVAIKVGANNQEKVEALEGITEGDVIYRTPPGGQADPKFDQPPPPPPASPEEVAKAKQLAEAAAKKQKSARSGRGSQKKFADMTADELKESKAMILKMSAGMSDKMSAAGKKTVGDLIKAIDAKDLDRAQQLRASMMKQLMGGRSRGGRGGEGGRRGGQRGSRNGE